jgi:hypothetical protein
MLAGRMYRAWMVVSLGLGMALGTGCGDSSGTPGEDGGELFDSHIADTGPFPPGDATVDAFVPGDDAGTDPEDAGTDPEDAGSDPEDAGTDPEDAGTDPGDDAGMDAGTDPEDAGTDPGEDAGMDAGTDPGEDAGTDPGEDAGTDPGEDAGDPGTCVPLGQLCEVSVECCGDRTCQPDGTGTNRCSEVTHCKGTGETCSQATECCSLSCDGTCQAEGELCSPSGTTCGSDQECCSNICSGTCQALGGACSTLGETCASVGWSDGCCSKYCEDMGGGDLRCARSSTCGARGEMCIEDLDCCSGVCQDGRCPSQDQIGQKRFAGEPCQVDSDCASYACASRVPGGPRTCQFLGGCRPTGEICSDDWQCCSDIHWTGGQCNPNGSPNNGTGCVAHSSVDGLSTCSDQITQTGPKEPGEICRESDGVTNVHDCCFECTPSPFGVWRCGGQSDICLDNDEPCRTSEDCCSGVCSPHQDSTTGEIVLLCGPCVEAGGFCTTDIDCCNHQCTDGFCAEPDDEEPPPECLPLGAGCTESAECCSEFCSFNSCRTGGT